MLSLKIPSYQYVSIEVRDWSDICWFPTSGIIQRNVGRECYGSFHTCVPIING